MGVREKPAGFIVLKNVRLSYAHIFEKHAMPTQPGKAPTEPRYSVSLMWPKSDKAQTKRVEEAIEAAMQYDRENKHKLKGKTVKTKNFNWPMYDGDVDRPDKAEYEGMVFVNAGGLDKPGVVDKNLNPIVDKEDVQSGDYANVSVTFFAFNNTGFGVSAGLGNVQFIKTGERFSNRSSVEDDFSEVDDTEDEATDDVDQFM